MSNIISIRSFELDLVDEHGTSHWLVAAIVDDMVQTLAPRYNPPDFAHPAEYRPALCWTSFELEDGELPPPVNGTDQDQIAFLDALDLDWTVDED